MNRIKLDNLSLTMHFEMMKKLYEFMEEDEWDDKINVEKISYVAQRRMKRWSIRIDGDRKS